tara:strand:- start:974 stop:1633 length:660 start_codon:yes stop_codon:yes gene_type:complete
MGATVAVPALTSAFGGTMAASTIAAPALLSAASVAAPIAAAGSSMMMAPSIMNAGGGGFFGNLGGGLLSGMGPMDAVFGITQGLSAIQNIKQGQILKDQYKIQELEALSNMEKMKFEATMNGIERLDKLRRLQAANISKSYAGGVSGLDGSALLSQIVSDQEYGQDYKIDLMNLDNIASTGKVNADIYGAASKRAPKDAMIDAGIKLGEAAYSYKKLYG